MRTASPHLGPLKSPTGTKSSSTWSPENRGSTTTPSARKKDEEKKKNPSAGAVWTPAVKFKKIINLIYKREFSLVFNLFKFVWYMNCYHIFDPKIMKHSKVGVLQTNFGTLHQERLKKLVLNQSTSCFITYYDKVCSL